VGFPNYFGPQRFGFDGKNFTAAVQWLTANEGIKSLPRTQRSLYLSAVRSAAFNHVLAQRVRNGTWNQLRTDELCSLDGTNSVFTLTEEDRVSTNQRVVELDVKVPP